MTESVSLTQASGWYAHYGVQIGSNPQDVFVPITVWTVRTDRDPIGWVSGPNHDLVPAWNYYSHLTPTNMDRLRPQFYGYVSQAQVDEWEASEE